MPNTNPSPSELLRRYRRNVYPPSLSENEGAVVIGYLATKGLEPNTGAVSGESRLKTQSLVKMAENEMGLRPDLAKEAVVGPHEYGESDAISLYVLASRPDIHPDTRET